jgi:hypothetical protein
MAEEKLSTLRNQLINEKKEENPFIFTAAPSLTQTKVDQKGGKNLNPEKLTIENSYTPIPISTNVHNSIKTSSTRYPGKPRKSWPFRLLFLTIFILSSIIGFKIWDGVSSKAANAYQDTKSLTVTKTSPNSADSKTKAEHIDEPQGHQKSNVTKPIAQPSPTSLKIEEAKLQAELDLRRIAEEEFLLLSN